MAEAKKKDWIRVSKRDPCPICGKPDYCTKTADGRLAQCMRVESDRPSKNRLGGWLHWLTEDAGGLVLAPVKTYEKPKISYDEWTRIAKEAASHKHAKETRVTVAKELGVSYESLLWLCVGWGWDEYRHVPFSTWPQFNHKRQVTGIIRRYENAVTEDGGNKLSMRGGSPGLHFVKYGSNMGRGPLCIVEGGSDTAALVTLGVPVIGRPSNLGGVDILSKLIKRVARPIVVIGEHDFKPDRPGKGPGCPPDCIGCNWCFPGLFGARSVAEELGELLPGRNIRWAMAPEGYKDSRAWFQENSGAKPEDFVKALIFFKQKAKSKVE